MAYEMAKGKRYEIVGKKIYAKISILKDSDIKSITNYQKLGYDLIEYEPPKKERVKTKLKDCKYDTLEKYIKENAKDKLKAFNEAYNEPMCDKETGEPLYYKNDSKDGKHKKGEPRVKGYMNAFQWFKKEFPDLFDTEN